MDLIRTKIYKMATAFKNWKFKKRVSCLGMLIVMCVCYRTLEFRHLQYPTEESYPSGRHSLRVQLDKERFVDLYFKKMLHMIMAWFLIKDENQKDVLLNKHGFVFGLNSRKCLNVTIGVLIVVHSDPRNVEKRAVIRNTWGSVRKFRDMSVACVFMMGQRKDIQPEIVQESRFFGDIVQGNFEDSYDNLTYKHVMALHWVITQCRDVSTIVKLDDDVFVDIFKLVDFSLTTGHYHNRLYCNILQNGRPYRRVGKWITSRDDYPFEFYPDYCEGMAYILSVDEARRLLKASENTRFYWIDDVYVTGILAHKAGIGRTQFQEFHTSVRSSLAESSDVGMKMNAMFFHELQNWTLLWQMLLTQT